MDTSFLTNTKNKIFLFACTLLAASLFFSKFLINVAIVLLVLSAFFRKDKNGLWRKMSLIDITTLLRYKKDHLPFFALITLFIFTVLSLPLNANISEWLHFVQLKLPFLLIPLAFMLYDGTTDRERTMVYYIFIIAAVISGVGVLGNYILDFEAITMSIGKGKSIPTPVDNNKYSTMLAFAVFAILDLAYRRILASRLDRIIFALSAIFLVIMLHILSIRSGLIILYAGLLFAAFYYLLRSRRYLVLLLTLVTMAAAPVAAYYTLPSFKNKIGYTMYDLEMQRLGAEANYSDGERLRSMKVGWAIFCDKPILGDGVGDLRDSCNDKYQLWYPESEKKILPHNQWLFQLAAYGIVGFMLLLMVIIAPLWVNQLWQDNVIYLQLLICSSLLFMVEKPLEEAVFIAFFALFSCLHYRRLT